MGAIAFGHFFLAVVVGSDGALDVEAVGGGEGGTGEAAVVPFAEVSGGVARLLEEAGEGGNGGVEKVGYASAEVVGFGFKVAADAMAGWKMAGCEGGTTGRADGAADVGLCEEGALGGEAVEVGRFDLAVAVATEGSPAEVVGEDEEDVGAGRELDGGEEVAAGHGCQFTTNTPGFR